LATTSTTASAGCGLSSLTFWHPELGGTQRATENRKNFCFRENEEEEKKRNERTHLNAKVTENESNRLRKSVENIQIFK
jgi:hypothetical protein